MNIWSELLPESTTLVQIRFLQTTPFSNRGGPLRKLSLTIAAGTVAIQPLLEIYFQGRFH
jgi:hypothetical protein